MPLMFHCMCSLPRAVHVKVEVVIPIFKWKVSNLEGTILEKHLDYLLFMLFLQHRSHSDLCMSCFWKSRRHLSDLKMEGI